MLKVKVNGRIVRCAKPKGRGRALWGKKLAPAQMRELKKGIPVEAEHGVKPPQACAIALDHLAEFQRAKPGYYTELARMERRLKRGRR